MKTTLLALTLCSAAALAADPIPPETFLWGVCQVGGTGKGAVWPLSRDELVTLHDELHCNALRFFVHPGFIGLPQKTWNGPEAVDYARAAPADYVWRNPSPAIDSLDEVLDLLYSVGLHPVLLPLPVDEYVAYLSRDDLTALNNPQNGLDYTGIRPAEQVKSLSVAIARHVFETYGPRFSLIYTEVCGQGDGAPQRLRDKERWADIVAAIKAVAPGVTVYSPELCLGMWWWAAARQQAVDTGRSAPPFADVPYTDTWPRGDRLENYRDAFEATAISYYGTAPDSVEWKDIATDQPALKAASDVPLGLARAFSRPKSWLWAEAGWGCEFKPEQPAHLERDLALLLFGMDHCRGALLWQGKDNEGSTAGVFTKEGKPAKGHELLKAVAEVVQANAAFFAADHAEHNGDGFPVASPAFKEGDPAVLTRLLDRHLLVFSEAPVMTSVRFTATGGRTLSELPAGHGYSRPWPLKIGAPEADAVTVSDIRPRVLYLLQVAGP
ncbi:MAG: hypothetical protein HYU66_12255 [Armatimonadetes bacterium]|nr:hypothetical protein [Armatimonadota bacterium]